MGARLVTAQRASLDYAIEMEVPVGINPTGLRAIHRCDGGRANARKNLADANAPLATLHGMPEEANGYLVFDGGVNWLETMIGDVQEGTLIAWAKCLDTGADAAHQSPIIGSYQGPADADATRTSVGANIYQRNNASIAGMVAYRDGATPIPNNKWLTLDPSAWHMLVLRFSSTNQTITDLLSNPYNEIPFDQPAGYVRDPNKQHYGIGGFPMSNVAGNTAVASGWIFERRLDQAELPAMRNWGMITHGALLSA